MKKIVTLALLFFHGICGPSFALDQAQVSLKMADIQVLMLVNRNQEPRILPDLGIVAAFSKPSALALQRSFSDSENLFFKRLALDEFNTVHELLSSNNRDLIKTFLPDPAQFDPVVGLLLNQGIPYQAAKQRALSEPFLFCPQPLIRINISSSMSKKTVVCSQNYIAVSLLVNKYNSINEGKSLVKIYTIDEIKTFLLSNNSIDAKDLVILPLPEMEQ